VFYSRLIHKKKKQESRAIVGRTAQCRSKFRYQSFQRHRGGFHYDSTAFELKMRKITAKITVLIVEYVYLLPLNSLFDSHCLHYKHVRD